MKKVISLCFFLWITYQLSAQQIVGRVYDGQERLALEGVRVSVGEKVVFTDGSGVFRVPKTDKAQSIYFLKEGYRIMEVGLGMLSSDTLRVYLKLSEFILKPVTIFSKRSYEKDSIALRNEFAAIFNYKAPSINDMFVKRGIDINQVPSHQRVNSTASIIGLDLLQVAGWIGKGKNKTSRLQKQLLEEEARRSSDHAFSKEKVTHLTHLTGDSLQLFMETYRPDPVTLKKWSEYELFLYIKDSYKQFKTKVEKSP